MGGGEDLSKRGPAQDEGAAGGVIDTESEVGLTFSDAHEGERTLQTGVLLEPRANPNIVYTGRAHRIVYPPSIAITCPVQYEEASDARNRSTPSSSSIWPGRPSGS